MTELEQLRYLRQCAIAFANVAVLSDPTLKGSATLKLLLDALVATQTEGEPSALFLLQLVQE